MAEGLARELGGGRIDAYSAGTSPVGVNPLTVDVMRERGIDLSSAASKSLGELTILPDVVISLCGEPGELCATYFSTWDQKRNDRSAASAIRQSHWPIPDPAQSVGDDAVVRARFREVRDEIERRVSRFLASVDVA